MNPETAGKKILIVDDEPDVIAYLSAFFEDNGFTVLAALNGRDGIRKAREHHPDLISLDITMPQESGIKMLRNLRENPETNHIPVIIITGTPGTLDQYIEQAGGGEPPAGYFEKPVNRDQLLRKTREILGLDS